MMTTRGAKYANALDKENIAPAFDAENILFTAPPTKMKHQETNHYLDLHTPNDKNKHADDIPNDNSNTPNHSMELTSEEINERCKLLKLKIQRMREIAANDTGNVSSNITDDLKKKEEKEPSSELVPETPVLHANTRPPLQSLPLQTAGSTPFGAPKQSSHIPQKVEPVVPASSLRARRFGGQLSKPPVRVRFPSEEGTPDKSNDVAQPSSNQPTTPYTKSLVGSQPATPLLGSPIPTPEQGASPSTEGASIVATSSSEMVLLYEKKSVAMDSNTGNMTGEAQGAARKVANKMVLRDIPPFNPAAGRGNTDTLLSSSNDNGTKDLDSPSLGGLKERTAVADRKRSKTDYNSNRNIPTESNENPIQHNFESSKPSQRRVSDEGVVPSSMQKAGISKLSSSSGASSPNSAMIPASPFPSPPISPLSAVGANPIAKPTQQQQPQQQGSSLLSGVGVASEGVELRSIAKRGQPIEAMPSSVSDRKVHFDEVAEPHRAATRGGGGEEMEGKDMMHAAKKATPSRRKVESSHPAEEVKARPSPQFKFDQIVVNGRPYVKLDLLGKGGSSQVYRVLSKNLHIYALKCVSLETNNVDNLAAEGYMNEISLLKKLNNHDNIIRLIDSEIRKGVIFLLLECAETDLDMMIKRQIHQNKSETKTIRSPNLLPSGLGLNHVRLYWEQMLEAVHTIHEERIVHGDLKPANFVCVQGRLKLIDFGIAKAIQNDTTNIVRENQVGTMNYISPEALTDISTDAKQCMKLGRASDIWSLGCILYQMVYGRGPFASITNLMKKVKAITDSKYKIEYPPLNNDPLLDVVQRCLQRDPRQRLTIPELLHHPFLQ